MDFLTGLAGLALQVTLVGFLLSLRIYRRFVLFFAYCAYSVIALVTQIWAMPRPFFFTFYRITEIVDGILALLVIYEVLQSGFKERHENPRWLRILPSLIAVALLADSFWEAFFYPLGRGQSVHLAAGIYSFKRDVLCLEIAALVLALRLDWRKLNPIRWGRHRFAIIAGFGGPAVITLFAQLLRTYFGAGYEEAFRYLPSGAYFGQLLIWLGCFFRDEARGTQAASQEKDPLHRDPSDPIDRHFQSATILPQPSGS